MLLLFTHPSSPACVEMEKYISPSVPRVYMCPKMRAAFPEITVIPALMNYEITGPQELFDQILNPPPVQEEVQEVVKEPEETYDMYKLKPKNAKTLAVELEKEREASLIPSREEEFKRNQIHA